MQTLLDALRWTSLVAVLAVVGGCGKNRADYSMAKDHAPGAMVAALPESKESASGGAAESTWKRSNLQAHTSRLMVGDTEELPIRGMQVHAQVDGFRARVLIDFFFANESSQTYEGTFKLRLPEGASPYFLAFGQSQFQETKYLAVSDVQSAGFAQDQILEQREQQWIEPKVARMVPRKKAAQAYTETVRRAVDPALLEWAGAGVFNARVFPLQPGKLHRVVVGYDVNLTRVGQALELALPIPESLPSAMVDVTVAQLAGSQISVSPESKRVVISGAEHHRIDNARGKVVNVRLNNVGQVAITGEDASTGPYFAARLQPELPAARAGTRSGVGIFVVDKSMSSNPDKFNVWLKLMGAILEENRGTLKEFAVLFFSVDTQWWKTELVANTPENVSALMAYANELALEGATDLGAALGEAARPSWLSQEKKVLFDAFLLSDGAVTWGTADRYGLSERAKASNIERLFSYRTGMEGTDSDLLNHLARETGGAVFSVVGESEVKAAATAHRTLPWQLNSIAIDGTDDLIVAGRPRVVYPGQRLLLAGRGLLKGKSKATFELSRGGVSKRVTVSIGQVVPSTLTPRAYGQLAVGQLEEFLGSTESFAGAYARHFHVTGKTTSLLMLETEEDYQSHNIRPADDAGLIKRTRVSILIAEALEELGRFLGDAKHAFLSTADLPNALRDALQKVAGSAFDVATPGLATTKHDWGAVQGPMRQQLASREPAYDDVVAAAETRRRKVGAPDALKAMSSLVEANQGDAVLARDVGFTALDWGLPGHAYHLFRRVAESRPFEPQSYWSMALALSAIGKNELALANFEIAINGEWDARYGPFGKIVSMDYLRFLRGMNHKQIDPALAGYAQKRLRDLGRQIGLDKTPLVVTITWNTDNSDVDLHVIEPSGEECYYQHAKTKSGGQLSQDVTAGYGPEMYVQPKGPSGTYRIRVKYFASQANRASARTKVYATVVRNWGAANESVTRHVVTLKSGKEMHDIATVKLP